MKVTLGEKIKCLQCGHEWLPRTDDVRQCPKCQSKFWDVPRDDKAALKDSDKDATEEG